MRLCIGFITFLLAAANVIAAVDPEWVKEQCPNAYRHNSPECHNGGLLYVFNGTEAHKESSCAHCDCPPGWGGLDCSLCQNIDVCPSTVIAGVTTPAVGCTNTQLLATEEEALGAGKLISCTCGGGEDEWSAFLCAQQNDTRLQLLVKGIGNETSPATIEVVEYAAVRRLADESWTGQFDYLFPAVFSGNLTGCVIRTEKCMDVPGTTVVQRDCTVYDCADTQVQCPPAGYELCEGFPDCTNSAGQKYKTHKCDAIPQSGKPLKVSCELEPTADGHFVCYYAQPSGFAALSVTCSVGECCCKMLTIIHTVVYKC
jgi:hypothetical protein